MDREGDDFEGLDISVADIKANITSLRAQLGRELPKTRATNLAKV